MVKKRGEPDKKTKASDNTPVIGSEKIPVKKDESKVIDKRYPGQDASEKILKIKRIGQSISPEDPEMKNKAWILTVDMGYGHQRAAYPLEEHAYKRIITTNNDLFVSEKEKKTWIKMQRGYEFISRLNEVPVLGNIIFGIYDQLQKISPFFPFRDLSKPSYSVLVLKHQIIKKQICKNIIENIKRTDLPVFATHFIPALSCEYIGMSNKIYCLITDTDVNRAWVTDKPKESNIIYLAPCRHVVVRLRQYGVPEEKIILTGFPLPKETLGGENLSVAKHDLGNRIPNLDPKGKFREMYKEYLEKTIGKSNLKKESDHKLTVTYLVGGAGALKNIGIKIAKSLRNKLVKEEIILNLVAGTNSKINEYYKKELARLDYKELIGKNINIIYNEKKSDYFRKLSYVLRATDIIWTKPSEMSFYTALGLPVIMTPPLGAHEKFNQEWLEHAGSGIVQEAPEYVNDWLFYWIEEGRFAEAALDGFTRAPNSGVYNIEKELFPKKKQFINRE